MFLKYGVSVNGELLSIDQVPRGQTALTCPYCGGALIAKKGHIKVHHFAHAGETCRDVQRDDDALALPAYDSFNLHLNGKDLDLIRRFHSEEGESLSYQELDRLTQADVVWDNEWAGRGGRYELTKKGKIVFGELSLMLFNPLQEEMIVERHDLLAGRALRSKGTVDYPTALADLRIYRAQMKRILTTTLYFIQIVTSARPNLYKIGVTLREITERVEEIKRDLTPHFGPVKINILGTWERRGNVEPYFKHRYHPYQQKVGDLTEYFVFDDIKPVLRDLRRMKPKALDDLDQEILAGRPSDAEQGLIPAAETLDLKSWRLLGRLYDVGEQGTEVEEQDRQYARWMFSHSLGGEALPLARPAGTLLLGEFARWVITAQGRRYWTEYRDFYQARFADYYEEQRRAQEMVEIEQRRRQGIRAGMQRAAARGKHVGRPTATEESPTAFLAKPKIQEVQKLLDEGGWSLRQISAATGVAVNTIRKVKAILNQD